MTRHATQFAGAAIAMTLAIAAVVVTPTFAKATAGQAAAGQTPGAKPAAAKPAPRWVMPRTPDGKPDLQGNWTNETQTPLERMSAGGTTLTDEQAKRSKTARSSSRNIATRPATRIARLRRKAARRAGSPLRANDRSSSRLQKRPAAAWAATTASGWIPD